MTDCVICGTSEDVQRVEVTMPDTDPRPILSVQLCRDDRQPLTEVVTGIQGKILAGIAP